MSAVKKGVLPLIGHDSRILILGTMPGEKSIALQQYYGNRGNYFWKILFAVFDEEFTSDYAARTDFLKRHGIALWNVLASCEREGSRDDKIINECVNDFDSLHRQYPGISHVFFESKAAEKFYRKYIDFRDGIIYSTLPSTSALNAGHTFEEKLNEWMILKNVQSF